MDATQTMRVRRVGVLAKLLTVAALLTSCGGSSDADSWEGASGNADPVTRAKIEAVTTEAMSRYKLRSLIVRITSDGQDVYTAAFGESLSGVPATKNMHFRNGSFAFTYIGQVFAKLVDEKVLTLDDKLAIWMPELPRADQVSVRSLLNMTSGYADYVYQEELFNAVSADPLRAFTTDQLISIGVAAPATFEPGKNWHYSHTNYAILGKLLERITKKPLDVVLREYVIQPMKLTATSSNSNTPAIPEPVLHSFTSERREFLRIPPSMPFYEDATFWNPSWTIANGAVQTTNIYDLTRSMEIVGSGAQVSPAMYEEQVGPKLIGFGNPDECAGCRKLNADFSYGMGVLLLGSWIAQKKEFAGSGVSGGYLPSRKLAISVSTTYLPEAFNERGGFLNASGPVFKSLAAVMAPGEEPVIVP